MPDTLQSTTPEKIDTGRIDKALVSASTAVSELPFNEDFQVYLSEKGVGMDTADPAAYWEAVASYTDNYLDNHETLSQTEKDSYVLTASMPIALTNSYYLQNHGPQMNYQQRRAAKEVVCSYNDLFKHYVTTYPVQADQMSHQLLSAVIETMGDDSRDFTDHAEKEINARIKGMKHEIGFTKILDSLGVSYRSATTDEDLKGRDVIIQFNGHEIGIDIKASLSEVDMKNRGSNGTPVAIKPNGDLVMFSMLLENDFNGGFIPGNSRIETIAPAAGALLQKALMQSIAK